MLAAAFCAAVLCKAYDISSEQKPALAILQMKDCVLDVEIIVATIATECG